MEWKLTEDQLAELKESFRLFDKDEDGKINIEDLRMVMRSLGYYQTEKELQEMLEEVDINNDHCIDFTEYIAFLARKCKEENGEYGEDKDEGMREIFNIFAKNAKNPEKITRDDLKQAMESYREEITEQELDEIYNEYSKDKQTLDFHEFVCFMFARKKE